MDRTVEFAGCCKVFAQYIAAEPSPPPSRELDRFSALAKRIAKAFGATEKLVERLKVLVCRKGISNDPSAEIEDVSKLFKQDMGALRKEIALLSQYIDEDARGSGGPGAQRRKHCQNIILFFQAIAKEHTDAFQVALHQRTATLKEQNERRRHFSHARGIGPRVQLDSPLFAPPAVRPHKAPFSAPVAHQPFHKQAAPSPSYPHGIAEASKRDGSYAETRPANVGLRRRGGASDEHERHAVADAVPPSVWRTQQVMQHRTATNRLVEARKVESMIGELGQMFSKFSSLVAEQQEVVMHIEDDVEAAHGHVAEGQAHLTRYYQIIQGNRGLIIKIFALLIGFIILLTIVF